MADPAAWTATITSSYGGSALLRLAGFALLAVALLGLAAARWAPPVALAGAAVALGSLLLAGHTITAQPRALVWAANLSHTAAAAVWLGGLVLLAVVLAGRRRAAGDPVAGARLVARFSTLAVAAVLVVTATGVALAWAETRSWAAVFTTSYGQLVLAKTALVAVVVVVVVAIGAYNNRWLVPAIRRDTGNTLAWRRLTRTVRWESAALTVGVLAITGHHPGTKVPTIQATYH